MNVNDGDWVTAQMPDGLMWDGVVVGRPTNEQVLTRDGIPVVKTTCSVVTLRDRLDGGKWYAFTPETVSFGRRLVMFPRYEAVIGLDADEAGETITRQDLMNRVKESAAAFNKSNFIARRTSATSAADL